MTKIIIGAATTGYPGWISTNMHELNLLRASDWIKYTPVECALAEHVWEHLTPEQGYEAARNVYQYVPRLRVAVPDGYYPDEAFRAKARFGEVEGDHNALYNVNTLSQVFHAAGYALVLLEWWSYDGVFHFRPWDDEYGHINRSLRYDKRNQAGKLGYTSIIMDCARG
jgi:predicted SAM-dependent methyltransferase